MLCHPVRPPLLAACLAVLCAFPVSARDAADSVEARLKAADIRYEVDKDGDYKVVVSYEDENRTQLVFVSGRTEQVGDLRIREVFAPAAKVDAAGVDAARANALLQDNYKKILGHWALSDGYLVYVIQLPDSTDAAGLRKALEIAAQVADDMEIDLTKGKDEF